MRLNLERSRVADGSAITKAIDYSLNHWSVLTRNLLDGEVPVSDNHLENQIHPRVMGRHAWLFAGSELAGQRAAIVMSLVHSAKLSRLDPHAHLRASPAASAGASGGPPCQTQWHVWEMAHSRGSTHSSYHAPLPFATNVRMPIKPMNSPFADCVAVVTGGGAGIGKAVTKALLSAGARVAVVDRDVSSAPAGAVALSADVTNDADVHGAIQSFGAGAGRIDLLVNNAGVSYPASVEDGPLEDWHRIFDINVLGYVRATRAALPFLRKSSHAAIVNMSSCTAGTGLRKRVLYAATKGAIESMTRAMQADLLHEGIRVNCVSPGTVDTPFIARLIEQAPDPAAQRQVYNDRQPTGFMVSAEEVARAVLYLAHPEAKSTVGTVIDVDGGMASLRLFSS